MRSVSPELSLAGLSGHGSTTLGGESEARSRSEFGSPGQIHVFRRDVPESFKGDPATMNRLTVNLGFVYDERPSNLESARPIWSSS